MEIERINFVLEIIHTKKLENCLKTLIPKLPEHKLFQSFTASDYCLTDNKLFKINNQNNVLHVFKVNINDTRSRSLDIILVFLLTLNKQSKLTHFTLTFHFYTLLNCQKTSGFPTFSGKKWNTGEKWVNQVFLSLTLNLTAGGDQPIFS